MSKLIIASAGEVGEGVSKNIELLDESGTTRIAVDIIRSNLQGIMKSLSYMLQDIDPATPGYALDRLSVAIGIDSKGKVGFLGIGGEASASATMTLEFKRASGGERGVR